MLWRRFWIGEEGKLRKNRFITALSILVFFFLFFPILIVITTSFGTEAIIAFPIKGFTLDWYFVALRSKTFMSALSLSLFLGITATGLALLVGIPVAYILSRNRLKSGNLIKDFFLSPTLIPGIVIGYSLFQFVVVGLKIPVLPALLLGHFVISVPYIIRVVGSAMEQTDVSIEEAAWTLGCTRVHAFFSILLPNITSGIFAAFMLAFINSFNNVPVSMFLSGPGVTTLPTSLLSYMEFNYDPSVSALSVVLMLVTILMMLLLEKNTGTREHWNVKTEMAAQNIFPPGKRAVASPLYG